MNRNDDSAIMLVDLHLTQKVVNTKYDEVILDSPNRELFPVSLFSSSRHICSFPGSGAARSEQISKSLEMSLLAMKISCAVPRRPVEPEVVEFPKAVPGHKELVTLPYAVSRAKCSKSFEKLVVFGRSSVFQQVAYMNKERIGLIRGPPGCGKSTTAWCFVLQYAQRYPEDIVCWVQAATRKRIILHNNIIRQDYVDLQHLHRVGDENVSVLCIAGVASAADFEKYREVALDTLSSVAKVMIVASLPVTPDTSKFISKQFEVNAWTLQEYQEACEHASFFAQVRGNLGADPDREYDERLRRELVERKFTVAGHSARWMFDMTESDVLGKICQLFRCVDQAVLLFYRRAFDLHSAVSRDLVLHDPTDPAGRRLVFTSDAVARAAGRGVLVREMHVMVNRYGANFVMQGHAARIDFVTSLRISRLVHRVQYVAEAGPRNPVASSQAAETPRPTFEIDFDNTFSSPDHAVIEFHRDVLTEESAGMNSPGTWFVPEVNNLGGFDCVQLLERGGVPTLRFVHVTVKVQQDHPIRRDCMHTFLLALNEFRAKVQPHPEQPIAAMEVVLMLPHDLALHRTPPNAWSVTGDESGGGSGGGAVPIITVTRRVAGFKLTSL